MLNLPDHIYEGLHQAEFRDVYDLWQAVEDEFKDEGKRWLCLNDRYYLLVRMLNRLDMIHPWLYARCREVEADPDGYLDLWAREHYKSTIITFGGCIQALLQDPEVTIGIFSHTKPVAKKFLAQIQYEFENNYALKTLFDHVLYQNPVKDSPAWSLDGGITVRRKSNPKEASIEAHGLVDGMPTSRHFKLLVYDDVVTEASVSTTEQIQKTTKAWELSDNLGAIGGRKWHIGTRYSYADSYESIIERGAVIPRIYPATDNGKMDGAPVFFPQAIWDAKVIAQGEATIACQMLQDPLSGTQRMFNQEDLHRYQVRPETLNIYIMVDPARSKRKGSAKTAIMVVGIDYANNKYLMDGMNHKMDLRERWTNSRMLYWKWKKEPGVQHVYFGYESFGAQADMDYFLEQMKVPAEGGHFPILELAWPREGEGSKVDRVQRLGPDFRSHKFFLPYDTDPNNLTTTQRKFFNTGQYFRIAKPIRRKENDRIYDLSKELLLQVHFFPFGGTVDAIDALSRLYDMEPKAPSYWEQSYYEPQYT